MNENVINFLWVGLGGFLGAVSRYATSKLFQLFHYSDYPISTLSINILGSLLIGFFTEYFFSLRTENNNLFLFLTVGLCGGFTTFSAFSLENIILLKDGHFIMALVYISSSVIGGLLALALGIFIAKSML